MLSGAWQEVNGQPTNYDPRPLRVEHAFTVARRQGLATALAGGGERCSGCSRPRSRGPSSIPTIR